MSARSSPPPIDPNSAWATPPEAFRTHAERAATGPARVALIVAGSLLFVGAAAWLVATAVRLVDFVSADCTLLACAGRSLGEHVRAYAEAIVGAAGVTMAVHSAWIAARLVHGHRHLATLRRGILATLALLALWLLLAAG
jgi:hypothetical protein